MSETYFGETNSVPLQYATDSFGLPSSIFSSVIADALESAKLKVTHARCYLMTAHQWFFSSLPETFQDWNERQELWEVLAVIAVFTSKHFLKDVIGPDTWKEADTRERILSQSKVGGGG